MKKLTFLMLLMVFATSTINAQRFYADLEFPEINRFNMPDVTTFELRNGIKFYLVENSELPLINMTVLVRGGTYMDPDDKVGLGSFAFSQMRNGGTASYTYDELNALLEAKAAQMEAGMGLTSGSASMNILKEDFDEMLPVFIEMLRKPAYDEDRFRLARRQASTGISRRNDSPAGIAQREFRRLIYGPESVYGRQQEYATIDAITRDDLVAFHEQVMVGRNLKIAVIGDFRTRDMRRALERAFRDFPAGTRNELALPSVNYEFAPSINFAHRSEAQQSFIRIGHIGGKRDNPDYAALQLMNEILSGGFSGRLLQIIRTDMGLAYSVGGGYQSLPLYDGIFFVALSTDKENTYRAIEATIDQIRRLQTEEVTDRELVDARDRILNSLVFRYTSRASVLNERVSNEYNGLPADAFNRYIEELADVTVADIQRVALEYIRPDDLQILIVGNRDALADQLVRLGDVNEIDISIPAREVDVAALGGSAEEVLTRMATALLERDTEGLSVTVEGQVTQAGAGSASTKNTYNWPGDYIQQVGGPQGSQTFVLSADGSAKLVTDAGEQSLPEQFANQLKTELNRHYISLAINATSVTSALTGTEEIDGIETSVILLPDLSMTLYVSNETGLPVRQKVEEFNPMVGQEIELITTFGDWTSADGVTIAYSEVTTLQGQTLIQRKHESHRVNE